MGVQWGLCAHVVACTRVLHSRVFVCLWVCKGGFAHCALCELGCARNECMSVSAHGRAMRLCAHVVVCRRVLHTWVCVCECAKGGLHTWLCVHAVVCKHRCVCSWVCRACTLVLHNRSARMGVHTCFCLWVCKGGVLRACFCTRGSVCTWVCKVGMHECECTWACNGSCAHVVGCLHEGVALPCVCLCVCGCAKGGLHTWLCVHWGVQGGMHECVCTWVSMGVCGCAKGGGCKVVICECVNGCKDGGAGV